MSEPRLQDIEDYDTLKGDKKKVVWTVIIVGVLMAVAYAFAYSYFDDTKEAIKVEESIKTIPLK
ncbi:MAG: hypothetical protein RBR59_05380 [Sulfurimonadaceae bacterium]|jgi:flagellar basal body-associated protein FliL|nr:hypothetical protein [Sulfurimonadaceae bacterium]